MNNTQELLNKVSELRNQYQQREITSGNTYSLFKVLGLLTNELAHSSFLGDMLNPKGEHKQGSLFLNKFVEYILKYQPTIRENEKKQLENFDSKRAILQLEKSIGNINEDYSQGGRIDIYIESDGNQLIIENKINASDQPNQLLRYRNAYNNGIIIYLTLDGKASTDSNKELQDSIINLSYKDDIVKWLEICTKLEINQTLKGAINQYITTLNFLTNKSIYKQMNFDIRNILTKDKETFNSAIHISRNIQLAKNYLETVLFPEIVKEVANSLDLEILSENVIWLSTIKEEQCLFRFKRIKSNDDFVLSMCCEEGFVPYIGLESKIQDQNLRIKLNEHLPDYVQNQFWFLVPTSVEDFSTFYDKILDGTLKEELYSKISKILFALEKVGL